MRDGEDEEHYQHSFTCLSLVLHTNGVVLRELADCIVDEHRRNKYGQLKCGPGERESRGEEWDR